jgi:putative ABC transport system ATP-binding protein
MIVGISCRGLTKYYGDADNQIAALKSIDIDIYQSQITLLVGPSGSGKSTLLSIFANILTQDQGKVFLLGQDISLLSQSQKANFIQKNLGIVFQSLFLIPTLNIHDNVALPLMIAGIDKNEAYEKAFLALEEVNMEKRKHSLPLNLSKGQQQRVAIARAIVNDAKIVLFDEPTSALDAESGQDLMILLKHFAEKKEKTIFIVTHDSRIFSYANKIINLSDGRIVLK